jgi:hypothetical protein
VARRNLVAGAIVVAIFAIGGFVAARTFGTTGEAAIERMRPKWIIGGNPLEAVVVYIYPAGGAQRFTWISVGRFTYDERLQPARGPDPPRGAARQA